MKNLEKQLPFILRIAAQWQKKEDLPSIEEGCILYKKEAKITNLSLTKNGNDIELSDLGFSNDPDYY